MLLPKKIDAKEDAKAAKKPENPTNTAKDKPSAAQQGPKPPSILPQGMPIPTQPMGFGNQMGQPLWGQPPAWMMGGPFGGWGMPSPPSRYRDSAVCTMCMKDKKRAEFSSTQWMRGPARGMKCKPCVDEVQKAKKKPAKLGLKPDKSKPVKMKRQRQELTEKQKHTVESMLIRRLRRKEKAKFGICAPILKKQYGIDLDPHDVTHNFGKSWKEMTCAYRKELGLGNFYRTK